MTKMMVAVNRRGGADRTGRTFVYIFPARLFFLGGWSVLSYSDVQARCRLENFRPRNDLERSKYGGGEALFDHHRPFRLSPTHVRPGRANRVIDRHCRRVAASLECALRPIHLMIRAA